MLEQLMGRNRRWYSGRGGAIEREWDEAPMVAVAFAAGVALGAVLMYVLDPDRGRRRRALIRDQAVHVGHEFGDLGEDARGRATDLRNRAQGVVAETRRALPDLTAADA